VSSENRGFSTKTASSNEQTCRKLKESGILKPLSKTPSKFPTDLLRVVRSPTSRPLTHQPPPKKSNHLGKQAKIWGGALSQAPLATTWEEMSSGVLGSINQKKKVIGWYTL